MQLMVVVVQDEDADRLCTALAAEGIRTTRINTAGGFLARRNVTVLIGVADERVEEVMGAIRANCRARRSFINPLPWGPESAHHSLAVAAPLEVQIGGATVFSFPVRRFVRIRGGDLPSEEEQATEESHQGASYMDLVLAIVQSEDADPVSQALLAAGYRLTRMNTAGGFLRRGNATLLIGVEHNQVDDVLRLIHANCRPRPEANPPESGLPMYGATVFVMEASRFAHM